MIKKNLLEISLKYLYRKCGGFAVSYQLLYIWFPFFECKTLDIKMERVIIKLWFSFNLYRFLVLVEILYRNIDIHLNAILFYYMYLSSDNRGMMAWKYHLALCWEGLVANKEIKALETALQCIWQAWWWW